MGGLFAHHLNRIKVLLGKNFPQFVKGLGRYSSKIFFMKVLVTTIALKTKMIFSQSMKE